jgi:periplasmic protein TonB
MQKLLFITSFLSFLTYNLKAQVVETELVPFADSCFEASNIVNDSMKIWDFVEFMPVFPGGDQALLQFLSLKIKYPIDCEANGSRVIFSFIIEKNGDISNLEILKILNECSIPIIKNVFYSMPCWTPGIQNGVRVRVKYTLPIHIRVE